MDFFVSLCRKLLLRLTRECLREPVSDTKVGRTIRVRGKNSIYTASSKQPVVQSCQDQKCRSVTNNFLETVVSHKDSCLETIDAQFVIKRLSVKSRDPGNTYRAEKAFTVV